MVHLYISQVCGFARRFMAFDIVLCLLVHARMASYSSSKRKWQDSLQKGNREHAGTYCHILAPA